MSFHVSCVLCPRTSSVFFFFFFNDTATTEIYTLSLHDALPISRPAPRSRPPESAGCEARGWRSARWARRALRRTHWCGAIGDRKSTRLNSSHLVISYAVFCLKKKKKNNQHRQNSSLAQDLY